MIVLDPLSTIIGAGPMGGVAAWLLSEVRSMRNKLVEVIERQANASERLATNIAAQSEVQKLRAVADQELANQIAILRTALKGIQ